MRKKLFAVLFALAAALSLVFAFSACGQNKPDDGGKDSDQVTTDPDDEQKPGEHTHTFADTWSFDGQNHWHAATCGHDEKSDFGAHNITGGVCTVCGVIIEGTEGLVYTLSDDGNHYIVSGMGAATTTDIVIPSTYNDLPVTSIGDSAFKDCTTLTSVTIPDSVTSIGDDAFENCRSLKGVYITDIAAWCAIDFGSSDSNPLYCAHNLYLNGELVTELVIPEGVTSIGSSAFYNSSSLTSVTIGDGVTSIGSSAFSGCINITTATMPAIAIDYIPQDNLQTAIITGGDSIGDSAFRDCSSLTNIAIPDSVTSIGEYAFSGCNSLDRVYITDIAAWCTIDFYCSSWSYSGSKYYETSNPLCYAHNLYLNGELVTELAIPEGVTSISEGAFYNCSGLTSVTIPNSVTSIGGYAFEGCDNIIQIENGVSYADKWAIRCDDSATSVELRANTVGIANSAFSDCSSLKSVTIPDGVTSIGDYAFEFCRSLTSITIPDSVTSIGRSAFYGCDNIIQIENGVSYVDKWAIDCDTSVISVELRTDTVGIGDYALYRCSSLTSITIPDSVTSIGRSAFYLCRSLETVYYAGSEEDWQKIDIGNYNYNLTNAEIIYNYGG